MAEPCRCGLCCEVFLIEATAEDARREPRIALVGALVYPQPLGHGGHLQEREEVIGYVLNRGGAAGGACLFLGRDAEGRGVCTIHATRPKVCPAFDCHGAGRLQLVALGHRPGEPP